VRSFFDTNVLVYTDDADSSRKQEQALALVHEHRAAGTGAVSTQVLQEYFVTTTRKLGIAPEDARAKVALFAQLDVVVIDVDHILNAIDLHRLHQFSLWDALIVEAARRASCPVLLTEDLQHGQRINGVEILNPFL
jgi:predicted nucleic acid-binding protein